MEKYTSPENKSVRILSLDFLRGIAILGIVFINVESFVYPEPWSNWKYGFISSIDQHTRFWIYFLIQGKFYVMFALLFGASSAIFIHNQKLRGVLALEIYARRLLWLFVIGVLHAYLLWDGDILYHYAICGLLLIPFQSLSNKTIVAVIALLATFQLFNSYSVYLKKMELYSDYNQAIKIDKSIRTDKEQNTISVWERRHTPKLPMHQKHEQVPKISFWDGIKDSINHQSVHKGELYYQSLIFSTLIVMLLGMLFFKFNIFSNYKQWNHYWLISLGVLGIGLYISYLRSFHWTYQYHEPMTEVWKAMLITFNKEVLGVGYILILNGLFQLSSNQLGFKYILNVGKMALSNYLLQSVLLGFLFYGYGFALFNKHSRFELLGIVILVWAIQIALSQFWLRHFKKGPMEYLWRHLTYNTFNK